MMYNRLTIKHFCPSIGKMPDLGIPVVTGTNGIFAAGFNPWPGLYWFVLGNTACRLQFLNVDVRLSKKEAIRLYTHPGAWFSSEKDRVYCCSWQVL